MSSQRVGRAAHHQRVDPALPWGLRWSRSFYPVVDYDDYALDDFDDLFILECLNCSSVSSFYPTTTRRDRGSGSRPSAVRSWPSIIRDGFLAEARTLVGTGSCSGDRDLSLVLNDGGTDDIDQEVDAVDFLAGLRSLLRHASSICNGTWTSRQLRDHGIPVTLNAGASTARPKSSFRCRRSIRPAARRVRRPSGSPSAMWRPISHSSVSPTAPGNR